MTNQTKQKIEKAKSKDKVKTSKEDYEALIARVLFKSGQFPSDDLKQICRISILKGLASYDPLKNANKLAYLSGIIRRDIINHNLTKNPIHQNYYHQFAAEYVEITDEIDNTSDKFSYSIDMEGQIDDKNHMVAILRILKDLTPAEEFIIRQKYLNNATDWKYSDYCRVAKILRLTVAKCKAIEFAGIAKIKMMLGAE